MPRIVIMGCGTGVGKTRVALALLRELKRLGCVCAGLKPIESGVESGASHPGKGADAAALSTAGSLAISRPHPLYPLAAPVSPHLAARLAGQTIALNLVVKWVEGAEAEMAPLVLSDMATWSVVESAGGVFSPLSATASNFDLGVALDPAIWILVASDSLGVLHDLSSTLQAMKARGRVPDHVVLSAARTPDASTASNASELSMLGIVAPTAVLARDDDRGIHDLATRLLGAKPVCLGAVAR